MEPSLILLHFFQNEIGRFRATFGATTEADDELVEKLLTPVLIRPSSDWPTGNRQWARQ
jgi:hypothetical protein